MRNRHQRISASLCRTSQVLKCSGFACTRLIKKADTSSSLPRKFSLDVFTHAHGETCVQLLLCLCVVFAPRFFSLLSRWMLFRGQPLEQLFPWTVIPDFTFVANVCKPEEVQGVKIGYLVHMARRQENILYHFYPNRFEIYKRLNLNILPADRLLLDFPFKVEKESLPLQGELGYLIPHVPEEQREDV
ncbi:putative transmembrane protein [Toxoplasma gondii VAND]|uniref:Putative transmembrane protein n=1 Tax=Toxoplasma gondii VAND TaxID=933077 RepID=A0A086Q2Z8_TOXGO|nr:putative transmembrane protein [Toxoplasma gondii VAND]